jgi:hypothetical protein
MEQNLQQLLHIVLVVMLALTPQFQVPRMKASPTLTPETLAERQNLAQVVISVAELWRNLMLLLHKYMSDW